MGNTVPFRCRRCSLLAQEARYRTVLFVIACCIFLGATGYMQWRSEQHRQRMAEYHADLKECVELATRAVELNRKLNSELVAVANASVRGQ